LIDADKIADYICDKCGADNCDRNPTRCIERDFAMDCAKEMPEVVVRCKDCKYADKYAENNETCGWVAWYNKKDDFCSMGKRKEK